MQPPAPAREVTRPVEPHLLLGLIGALAPLAFVLAGAAVFFVTVGPEAQGRLGLRDPADEGRDAYELFGAAVLVAIALIPILLLISRARGLPAIVALALASVPAWASVAMWTLTVREGLAALLAPRGATIAELTVASALEAFDRRLVGEWFASAALSGTALGLAFAAAALRPVRQPNRRAIVALPLLAAAGVGLWALFATGSSGATSFLLLPALAAFGAVALAITHLGAGAEARSTGTMVLASAVCGALGIASGGGAFLSLESIRMFEHAVRSERAASLAADIPGVACAHTAENWMTVLAAGSAVMVAAIARRHARTHVQRASLPFLALAVVITFGAITWSFEQVAVPLGVVWLADQSPPAPPAASTLPQVASPAPHWGGAQVSVTDTDLTLPGGAKISSSAIDDGSPGHQDLLERFPRYGGSTGILALAVDPHSEAALLTRLAQLSADTTSTGIAFLTRPSTPPAHRFDELPGGYAELLALLDPPEGVVEFRIDFVDSPRALQARVSATGPVQLLTRSGEVAATVDPSLPPSGDDPYAEVFVEPAPDVTVERFLDVASALRARGYSVAMGGLREPKVSPPPFRGWPTYKHGIAGDD